MANIFDVAKYILNTIGDVSTMKLQKLCFYSQAISYDINDSKIFDEDFEAWANGPVSRELFNVHKGKFVINNAYIRNDLLTNSLSHEDIHAINVCLERYGDKDGAELSELSHNEAPWIKARKDTPEGKNCRNVISKTSIKEYYSS